MSVKPGQSQFPLSLWIFLLLPTAHPTKGQNNHWSLPISNPAPAASEIIKKNHHQKTQPWCSPHLTTRAGLERFEQCTHHPVSVSQRAAHEALSSHRAINPLLRCFWKILSMIKRVLKPLYVG